LKPRIQCHAQSGRSYNTLVIPTVAKRSGGICFYAAVPRELLAPRSMLLNFIHREAFTVQAMHLDCRTVLGPRVNVASLDAASPAHLPGPRRPGRSPNSRAVTADGVRARCRSRSRPAARTCCACIGSALSDVIASRAP
jgi:hypothetical protein